MPFDWISAPGLSDTGFLFLIGVSFLTSAISATFGLGGGVLLLVLMTYFLPVAALIPVHGAVQFGSNLSRMLVQRRHAVWPVLLPMLAGGVFGCLAGAVFTVRLDDAVLRLVMGVAIIILIWLPKQSGASLTRPTLVVVGGVINFISMVVGAAGPLTGTALSRTIDGRHALVASQAVFQTAQHGLKVLAFGVAGFLLAPWLVLICAMLVTGFLGTLAGSLILAKSNDRLFSLVFKIVITALALDLLRRGSEGINYA
ncbi:MAG: sulfite exporter TauE/SafE family protein [Pseudomonadota bacterium]